MDRPKKIEDSLSTYLQSGKAFFVQNCATCHAYNKDLTGPALQGLENRGPWSNRNALFAFTRNPGAFMATDCYTKDLYAKYGSLMTAFPQLDDNSLNALYDYLKNEDLKRGIKLSGLSNDDCNDSCRRYDSVRWKVQDKIAGLQGQRQALIDSNGLRINYNRMDSGGTSVMPTGDRDGFVPKQMVRHEDYQAIYYRFDITSFGWYNIDELLNVATGDASTLLLTVDESLSNEIDVFIAVPKYKTFDRGGKLDDGIHYGFFTTDGKIPLPVGEKVVVFALGEADGKILYDYKEFISTSSNEITLTPKEATKEEFNEAVKKFSLERIDIKATDSKNAGEIRKRDGEIKRQQTILEQWKPKGCDCDCRYPIDSVRVQ